MSVWRSYYGLYDSTKELNISIESYSFIHSFIQSNQLIFTVEVMKSFFSEWFFRLDLQSHLNSSKLFSKRISFKWKPIKLNQQEQTMNLKISNLNLMVLKTPLKLSFYQWQTHLIINGFSHKFFMNFFFEKYFIFRELCLSKSLIQQYICYFFLFIHFIISDNLSHFIWTWELLTFLCFYWFPLILGCNFINFSSNFTIV